MIKRTLNKYLEQALDEVQAIGLLGVRQVGKTTLALEVGEPQNARYLDLESEVNRARFAEAEDYLERYSTVW